MSRLKQESKQINRSKAVLLGLLMVLTGTPLAGQQSVPDGMKFEIVSIRVLSDKEAAERSPDFVGPNVAVRLRLSSSARGFSFYGWKNSVIPAGYGVQQTDQGLAWLYRIGKTDKQSSSPGLKEVLFGSTGEWITLPAHSAVEWEILDSTSFAGEKHAVTAFLKQRDKDEPLEVISETFAVPPRAMIVARHTQPPGVKFEVVSVRVLSDKEAADRSPDFVGPNVAVRLRLSCSGTGFYLYSLSDTIAPVGYKVKWVNNKVVWRFGPPGNDEHLSSPGIKKATFGSPGKWLLLSGHLRPVIEWEELDSTGYSGEKHAFTVFIKHRESGAPEEIISDAFVVPLKATAATP